MADLLKLINLQNQATEKVADYAGIAYDWITLQGNPGLIRLSVAVTILNSSGTPETKSREYTVDLRSNLIDTYSLGASEPIGLLPKTAFYYDDSKLSIFERNVGDIIMSWIQALLEEGIDKFFIQGPLFPKLLGRLGYRNFCREFDFIFVTFNPIWFPSSSLSYSPHLPDTFAFIKEEAAGINLDLVQLPAKNGIKEVVKTYTVYDVSRKEPMFCIDLYCQFPWEVSGKPLWEQKRHSAAEAFGLRGLVYESRRHLYIPFNLACAWECCRVQKRAHAEELFALKRSYRQLYEFELDVPQMHNEGIKSEDIVCLRTFLAQASLSELVQKDLVKRLSNFVEASVVTNCIRDAEKNWDRSLGAEARRGLTLGSLISNWKELTRNSTGSWKVTEWLKLLK